MKMNILILLVVGGLTYGLTLYLGGSDVPMGVNEVPIKAEKTIQDAPKTPDFSFTDIKGKTHDIQDFRGKIVILNFWASWCAPCRAEHPTLMQLAGQGVPIFGVNFRDNPDNAQAFLDELGNPYTMIGADPAAEMSLDWGVYGLPETFVVGPDGVVIARLAGPLTQRNLQTRLLPALEEAGLSF